MIRVFSSDFTANFGIVSRVFPNGPTMSRGNHPKCVSDQVVLESVPLAGYEK